MANPSVLQVATTLYCPAEPEGREFPAGHEWPGDAWSSDRGGKPVGQGATAQAMKDLISAQDTIDALSAQLSAKDHDMAQVAKARDEAVARHDAMEQRALAGEKGQADAHARAADYMRERDAARADHQHVGEQVRVAHARMAELESQGGKVEGLMAELNAANQTIADLRGQLAGAPAAHVKPSEEHAAAVPKKPGRPPKAA